MQNRKELEEGLRPPFFYLCLVQLEKLRYHRRYLFLHLNYKSKTLIQFKFLNVKFWNSNEMFSDEYT